MKVDFFGATAMVAVVVSITFWWQIRKGNKVSSENSTSRSEKPATDDSHGHDQVRQHVHEISVMDESGQEQKWVAKAKITTIKANASANNENGGTVASPATTSSTGTSSTRATVPTPIKEDKMQEPDVTAAEMKNFRAKDIPDFTIELDESDDDMF